MQTLTLSLYSIAIQCLSLIQLIQLFSLMHELVINKRVSKRSGKLSV